MPPVPSLLPFLVGVLLGALANVCAAKLAWKPKPIRLFSVRAILVMAGMGALAAWPPPVFAWEGALSLFRYGLPFLLVAISLIDMDEQTVPDALVVSGTLFALAAKFFVNLLSTAEQYPNLWASELFSQTTFLIAQACWWGWCFALMDRHWRMQRGMRMALAIFFQRLYRSASTCWILAMGVVGSFGLYAVWKMGAGPNAPNWTLAWAGPVYALKSLAIAGGMIWAIRIVGLLGLRREAMGFGDVLIMAMLGAFLGWERCLILFFIAPFIALLAAVPQMLLSRGNVIPFGPFLCLAAGVVLYTESYWSRLVDTLHLLAPYLLPLGVGLLLVMYVLLVLMRWAKQKMGLE